MEKHEYENIREYSDVAIASALRNDDIRALREIVIDVALRHEDFVFAEQLCRSLSANYDEELRGNAILGFGHLARRFSRLSEIDVRPIIEAGLLDSSEYVRGQSWAAADDISHFLKWTIAGYESEE